MDSKETSRICNSLFDVPVHDYILENMSCSRKQVDELAMMGSMGF